MLFSPGCSREPSVVGVGRAQVTEKIDLTDKLNPAILPDLLKEVLREITPGQRPDSEKFQQQVVQKLSQKIMDDPEVNYRVDLNEDGNLDPVLVVPEAVKGEAAVYSIRVPDPEQYPRDPPDYDNWNRIAQGGIELVALSATFDERSKTMTVNAESNAYLYEDAPYHHYRSEYPVHHHGWLETYVQYMIFRDILFGPYLWYGPGWYGGWYRGYYAGWHAPVATRTVTRTVTRYQPSPGTRSPMRTASGKTVRSQQAASRTQPPRSIQAMKSRRAMQARQAASARQGGFGRSGGTPGGGSPRRSFGGSFRGGGGGFGK
jgi:hypothetical protein